MSEFSSTDAALEGLRVSREHPMAVLWWWGAYVIAAVVEYGIGALPPFRRLAELSPEFQTVGLAVQQNPTDQAVMNHYLQLVGQVLPPMLLFGLVAMVIHVVLVTAVLRSVLRPADSAFGYLRLSLDELRQVGLTVIAMALFLAYAFVVSIVSALVTAIVSGLTGGGASAFVLGAIAFVMVALAFLYPAVRLSLASAMTFADGRISLFRSWPLTRGRFWPLFAAYLVAGTCAVMIAGFMMIAGRIVAGPNPTSAPQGFAALLSPLTIGFFLFNGLFGALFGAVTTAPGASAFRQLTGRMGAMPVGKPSSGSPWGQA